MKGLILHFARWPAAAWRQLPRLAALLIALWLMAPAAQAAPLLLQDNQQSIEAWPAVTILADPQKNLTLTQVQAAVGKFEMPATRYATLGVRTDPIWLRVPLKVDAASDGRWILDINYPPIQVLDVYLLQSGQLVQRAALGSLRPFESRPLLSRSHAVALDLAPATNYEVLIRAQSSGALIMPITLAKPASFHAAALREQMLQGLLVGLGLCLVIYGVVQWAGLRETFFLKYAVMVAGTTLFSMLQFGTGAQFLWTNNFWMEQHAAGITSLIALCGSFLFTEHALAGPGSDKTWFSRIMKGGAAASLILLVIYCLDIFNNRTLTALILVIGPLPSLLGIPGAIARARRGDSVGFALLLGWSIYVATTIVITGVIRGTMDANFWTMHAFQFGTAFDMLVFMYVLGQRTKAIRLVAQRASVERDLMRSLAITDPLTGLANRRGLREALSLALGSAHEKSLLAVYIMDVDGFKPVNDRYGHETGDALLVHMSQRMRSTMRSGDVVARLGGDEFVVLAAGLQSEQQAQALGTKLLEAFDQPFELTRHSVRVGVTIGYAIAPRDGNDTTVLLQLADAAMYAGKQAGKHCIKRATASADGVATPVRPSII
jgi:diguanylate cyclase (GGDEF)-like protein